jgi:hypothetical protein
VRSTGKEAPPVQKQAEAGKRIEFGGTESHDGDGYRFQRFLKILRAKWTGRPVQRGASHISEKL